MPRPTIHTAGIQKTWVNTYRSECRKFSDKERDAESGLDYFGGEVFFGTGQVGSTATRLP